jgi:hypothetical protein
LMAEISIVGRDQCDAACCTLHRQSSHVFMRAVLLVR